RKPTAPHRDLVLADLADVGDDAVDDDAGHFRDRGGVRNEPTESRVPHVAATVDDEDVPRAHLSERIADDRSVDARLMDGDRGTGDPDVLLHRLDPGIHEPPVAEVADRRGLRTDELFYKFRADLRR